MSESEKDKGINLEPSPSPAPHVGMGEEEVTKDSSAALLPVDASAAVQTEALPNTGIPRMPNVWENAAAVAAPHYWTPDPTKRFCIVCGDNDLGSVWGIHRFQIQPHDPDFTPPTEGT